MAQQTIGSTHGSRGLISGLSHVGLVVSDVEQASRWFSDLLGLECVVRQRQANEYTRRLVGIDDAVLEVAEFLLPATASAGGPVTLELVQYVRPPNTVEERFERPARSHISFLVRDIFAEYDRLKGRGVEFVSPPVRITEGVNQGGYACYFLGPDGMTLELFQPTNSERQNSELDSQAVQG
jgi:catechol 2,3-dioxygenase-like lactoylglutathione lyase family enzyme